MLLYDLSADAVETGIARRTWRQVVTFGSRYALMPADVSAMVDGGLSSVRPLTFQRHSSLLNSSALNAGRSDWNVWYNELDCVASKMF